MPTPGLRLAANDRRARSPRPELYTGLMTLSFSSARAGGDPDYPTPWANNARTSFLSTPEETRSGLVEAGFDVVLLHSTLERALAFGACSRAVKVEPLTDPAPSGLGGAWGAMGRSTLSGRVTSGLGAFNDARSNCLGPRRGNDRAGHRLKARTPARMPASPPRCLAAAARTGASLLPRRARGKFAARRRAAAMRPARPGRRGRKTH